MTFSVRSNKYKNLKFSVHAAKILLVITCHSENIFVCAFSPKKDILNCFSLLKSFFLCMYIYIYIYIYKCEIQDAP